MVNGKYARSIRKAIDEFWRKNSFPPTIRDLMAMCGVPSTSHVAYIVRRFDDVRIVRGHIIPKWVGLALRSR